MSCEHSLSIGQCSLIPIVGFFWTVISRKLIVMLTPTRKTVPLIQDTLLCFTPSIIRSRIRMSLQRSLDFCCHA